MSTGEPLFLYDYTPVGAENEDFCKRLQQSIDAGAFHIVDLGNFMEGKEEESKSKVFAYHKNSYWTQGYAGVLEFEGRTVTINSRFDHVKGHAIRENNTFFLQYCLETIGWNQISARVFMNMHTMGGLGLMSQLLIPIFLFQVERAYQVGVFRQYRSHAHNDSKVRGAIDISRHIRLNTLNNGKIAYNTRDYTLDNPTNHLILQVLQVISQEPSSKSILDRFLTHSPDLKTPFQRLTWELGEPSVKPSHIRGILEKNRQPITHPYHRNYEAVRRTALLILQGQGLSLLQNKKDQVQGFVLNMPDIWEKLLEATVFQDLPTKVEFQKKIPLFFSQKEKKPKKKEGNSGTSSEKKQMIYSAKSKSALKPDFYGEGHSCVLDAKYKAPWVDAYYSNGSWTNNTVREDVFQLISYLYTAKFLGGQKDVFCGVLFPCVVTGKGEKPKEKAFSLFPQEDSDIFHLIPCPVLEVEGCASYPDYKKAMDAHWKGTSGDSFRGEIQALLPSKKGEEEREAEREEG